jgi:2-polyprenyl-6-methoxyphenol hydroxylase-like FAD-dependent oxidoreductase
MPALGVAAAPTASAHPGDPQQIGGARRPERHAGGDHDRGARLRDPALIGITDGLNRLFANDVLPLRLARELGLGAVERIPPLKRFFMRHAMGLLGDLARVMRGEAL